jgi:hypothetical protein
MGSTDYKIFFIPFFHRSNFADEKQKTSRFYLSVLNENCGLDG